MVVDKSILFIKKNTNKKKVCFQSVNCGGHFKRAYSWGKQKQTKKPSVSQETHLSPAEVGWHRKYEGKTVK